MRQRPILLTGAAGFVGSTMLPRVREAFPDTPIVTLVRRRRVSRNDISLDLVDEAATAAALTRTQPSMIVHLAAYASVGTSQRDPSAVWRDNRDASFSLARAVATTVPDATVLVSGTTEVYGEAFNDGRVDEATRPRPRGPYATSKLASETVFRELLPPTARLILCRPVNHTGPGQVEDFVIPSLAGQVARAEAGLAPASIAVGNLEARRDFLDVQDVIGAYLQLMANADSLPMRSLYNIGSGRSTAIRAILDYFLANAQRPIEEFVDPSRLRPNDIPEVSVDSGRVEAAAGWRASRSLEATLADVLRDKRDMVRKAASG
ncbi:MAG: GDP-mannose 4,6-dehydratase [Acuticoccus sp.]